MISIRGKFWFNILRLFRWRLGSLLKVTQEKKQKNKLEFWRKAKNFNISDISFNDFKVIKFIPKNNIEGNFIIYLHGGGYVACGPETHASIVTQLSSRSRTTVLFPVYRLAPKFPFPSAIDDCLIVYKDLLEKGVEAKNISLVGDSAGGGLVMALLQILSKEKIDFPSSAILISPWTDLTLSGESMKERVGRDPMLHPGKEMDGVVKAYTGDEDPRNPLISSIFSNDLRTCVSIGFPATSNNCLGVFLVRGHILLAKPPANTIESIKVKFYRQTLIVEAHHLQHYLISLDHIILS